MKNLITPPRKFLINCFVYLLIISTSINTVFSQTPIQATHEPTSTRTIDNMYGFNGQNILQKDVLYSDLQFHQALNKLNPTTLRYPGGTIAMYWNWKTGKFLENDFSLSSDTWTLKSYSNRDIEPTTLEVLKSAVDNTCASPIFDFNIVTSDKYYQLAQLYHAGSLNLPINYVELGNEIYTNKLHSIRNKFQNGTDYVNKMTDWANLIDGHFPNVKIALVGAARNNSHIAGNPVRYNWNNEVLNAISTGSILLNIDAITLHPYDGSGLGSAAIYDNINVDCMLRNPYVGIIDNLFTDEINAILTRNSNLNIWHTEYNLFDVNSRSTGSWAHALFVAYQSLLYLEEENIKHTNLHALLGQSNWGSIFTNEKGLEFGNEIQPQSCNGNLPPATTVYPNTTQYDLTPAGQSMQMIMRAAKNAYTSTKVSLPVNSIPQINCNGTNYNGVYGWTFESLVAGSQNNMQTILLNFTDSDVIIDLDPGFQNPNTIESIWTDEYDHYFTGENESDCFDADGWTGGRPGCECNYNKDNLTISNNQITLKPYSINRIYKDNCGPVKITPATEDICNGSTLGMQANILPDVNEYNYSWTGPNGFTANTPNISITPNLNTSTIVSETYTLNISYAGSGCPQTRSISKTINVHPKPTLDITSNPANLLLCSGAGPLNLEAEIEINGSPISPNNFVWINDKAEGIDHKLQAQSSDIDVEPEETTTYTVYATSNNICYLNKSITIPVIDIGEDRTVCHGQQFERDITRFFQALGTSSTNFTINWSMEINGSSTPLTTTSPLLITPPITQVTTLKLTVIDPASGCTINKEIVLTPVECCSVPAPTPAINEIEDGTTLTEFVDYYNESNPPLPIDPIGFNNSDKLIISKNNQTDLSDIIVHGTFIINAKVRFDGINFKMAEGAEIILEPFTALTARGTGSNKTVFEACGSKMWKGIRVRPESKIELLPNGSNNYSAIIKDAEYAIYIENSIAPGEFESTVILDNAELLNNYVGILVQPKDATAKNNEHVILDIKESTFDGSTLKGTYYNQLTIPGNTGYAGIIANDNPLQLNYVSYEDGAGNIIPYNPNEFKNLNLGIRSKGGNITLSNNVFENIFPDPTYLYTNSGTAVHTSRGNLINIHNNDFDNFRSGIIISNPLEYDIDIFDNRFNEGLALPYDLSEYSYQAIRAEEFIKPTGRPDESRCKILDNIIENTSVGIHVRNINGSEILNNHYNTSISNSNLQTLNQTHYGIWVENCNGGKIENNEIIKSGFGGGNTTTANEQLILKGISIDNSTGLTVSENKVSNMGSGIQALGANQGTEFHCNNMENNYTSLYFNMANLNTQGTSGTPAGTAWDNIWNNNTGPLKVDGTAPTPVDWLHVLSDISSNDWAPRPFGQFLIFPFANQNPDPSCTPPPMVANNDDREEEFGEALTDTTFYTDYETENKYYEKAYFYESAKEDSSLLNLGTPEDLDYQLLFDSLENQTNMGEFTEVMEAIEKGNFLLAKTKNLNIIDENLLETNKQTAIDYYIEYFTENTDSLSATDTITLENIAYQNSIAGGEGVYYARAMLGLDITEHYISTYRRINPDLILNDSEIKFYPNPATNKVMIECYTCEEDLSLSIIDAIGKLVHSEKLIGGQVLNEINTSELKAGLYYFELYSNNKLNHREKISIVK